MLFNHIVLIPTNGLVLIYNQFKLCLLIGIKKYKNKQNLICILYNTLHTLFITATSAGGRDYLLLLAVWVNCWVFQHNMYPSNTNIFFSLC